MRYSIDFRRKEITIKEKESLSNKETAVRFGIGTTTLVRWNKQLEPKSRRNKPATKINMEALKEDVRNYPDSYVYERAKRLGASRNGVYYALKRLNVTYKKNFKSSESERRRETRLSE